MRALLLLAMIGASVWMAALLLPPLAQPGSDLLRMHPEDNASGAFGWVVGLGYAALALALLALVGALARRPGGSRLGLAMLLPTILLCLPLAASPGSAATLGVLLVAGVLGLGLGPLLLTLGLRRNLGPARSLVTGLAVGVVVLFGALVVAPSAIAGIVNRAFDALAGLWLVAVAVDLRAAEDSTSCDGRGT